eukprot:846421-Prorocentrum_lima.AAC.1
MLRTGLVSLLCVQLLVSPCCTATAASKRRRSRQSFRNAALAVRMDACLSGEASWDLAWLRRVLASLPNWMCHL